MADITDKLIQQSIERQERALAQSERRFQRSVYTFLQSYKRNLRRYIRTRAGSSDTVDRQAFDSYTVSRELRQVLRDSGQAHILELHRAELERLESSALKYFSAAGLTSSDTGISRSAVRAYQSFSEFEITRVMDLKLVDPVQNMMLATALGELPRSELVNTVARTAAANQIDASRANIQTTINDLHRGYQRHVTNTKADELGLDWYIYVGPLDRITSEQCEHMLQINKHGVPGLLKKDEISSDLHPAIPLGRNPLIYGGHINCRHKYYPITQEEAERRGFRNNG